MNGRLSRMQRDALERQDAPWLARPLRGEPAAMAAHIRHMVKLLRSKRSPSPCSEAMAHLAALYDRTIAHVTPPAAAAKVACRKGCAHCCVQPISITGLELFFLARTLRGREAVTAALVEAGRRIQAAPKSQRLFDMRCPMLLDNACSIYAERPLACHNFLSFNVNDCITRYVMLGRADVLMPAEHGAVINDCRLVLHAAMGLIGQRDFTSNYEMKAALAHVLEMDEDVEARWLAGEDVMTGVEPLPPFADVFRWDIVRLMDIVRPTL
jgi:Fe-S-cluster containining protein